MPSDNSDTTKGQPRLVEAALSGLCPQCNAPTLFEGIAKFAPRCTKCDLDFFGFNVGDGPAAFLTLIIGAVVVGLAMWLEIAVTPPIWVHALLWIPLVVLSVFAGLRLAKTWLIHAEYRNRAGEAGRDE
nr:DUF983 domain-containing protein [Parerythrobacter lutipelagi]